MPFVTANVLQPLINVFEQVLLFFHDTVGVGWGFSIILLTVTVRTVLLPLTYKQFKSMAALQRLAPEMKVLQAKYKDDKQRLNQEMMKFYQENKVNPFSSCLPLAAQMPVFISLFYMLRKDLKEDICGQYIPKGAKIATTYCDHVAPGKHLAQFLFIPDITAPGKGAVLAVLIVLYVGSQLLSSVLMSTTVDKNQQRIMLALPFLFVFFILRFPAGLLVYWITTNLWTVGQQYFVRRSVGMAVPGRPGTLPPPQPMFGGLGQAASKPEPAAAVAASGNGSRAVGAGGSRGTPPPAAPQEEEEDRQAALTLAARSPEALLADLLTRVRDDLGLDAEVEVSQDDDGLRGTLHGEDLGLFIGRHGQTIDAVQHLAQRAVAILTGELRRVVVDAEGYRDRRQDALERQADDAADAALAGARPVALDAMTAGERRLVHEHLRDREDVTTHSEGEEPDRHLVISPAS